jgi:arginine:agmatine antiporter
MTDAPRKIGPVLATALVAGNIIGAGVFLLPASLAQVGSVSLVGWVIATLGAFATTAVFAGLGAISGSLEGMVGYVDEGVGRFAGFAVAAVYWMGSWVAIVAISVSVAGYFAVFFPALATPLGLALTAAAAIWLFTLVNLVGARTAARLSGVSLVAGLLPIVSVALIGWAWFDPKVFMGSWNVSGGSDFTAVRTSMFAVFWAYTGFESAAVASAVVKNPKRDVPIATYGGTALAALVYVAASAVLMGVAPARELAASTAPFALAAGKMLGPAAAWAVALCALIKTCGSLCGWILVVGEAARAGANTHLFPGKFEGGRGVPWRIMLGMAAVMSAAALASVSPSLGKQFQTLVNVSAVWTVLPYIVCCLALWRLARGRIAERVAAGLALAFNAWLLTTSDMPTVWLTLGLLAVVAALWLVVWRRGRAVEAAA